MKIGVSGGTGFIGQYLLREYGEQYKFKVITSRNNYSELYKNENIEYIKDDYTEEGFKRVFSDCDCIVHLGAKRSDKEREKSICNYFDNIQISEALFEACEKLGITNIVNISSIAVYDAALEYPFAEKGNTTPISNYGIVKRAIEDIAYLKNKKNGMKIKSLRVAQVMGVGERAGYMLSIFLDKCLKKETLSVYGTGKAGREYIYVKDVAKAIICAAEAKEKAGVYNIGSGVLTSNLELAQSYCSVFENEKGYVLLDKPEVLEYYLMNVKLAEKELGFKADYTVKTALEDMKVLIEKE